MLNLDLISKRIKRFVAEEPSQAISKEAEFFSEDNPQELDRKYRELQNHEYKEKIDSLKQDREIRKAFAKSIFIGVASYISLVLVTLWCDRHTSDKVLQVLLATTSINIIALLASVVRYLFPLQK